MRYFLTGYPGSGKTFLGALWAADNGLKFYDLDALIEEEERMTVSEIFAQRGEDYFREKEAAVLRNTDRFENCIIACGGGTSCFYDNADWMNRNGTTIFLKESDENIYHHIINDKNIRPLFGNAVSQDLKTYIAAHRQTRMPFYEQAKVILEEAQLNRNGFSQIILQPGKYA